jgi:hypothetical protein
VWRHHRVAYAVMFEGSSGTIKALAAGGAHVGTREAARTRQQEAARTCIALL